MLIIPQFYIFASPLKQKMKKNLLIFCDEFSNGLTKGKYTIIVCTVNKLIMIIIINYMNTANRSGVAVES